MNTGDKIKLLRSKKRWTQQELAEKAHVSRVSIGNYERNDRTPDAENLKKIAEALGVTPDELLDLDTKRIDFIKTILNKYPYDKKLSDIAEKIKLTGNLSREDPEFIDSFKVAEIVIKDIAGNPNNVIPDIYVEAYGHFKEMLNLIGYDDEYFKKRDINTIILFNKIRALLWVEFEF